MSEEKEVKNIEFELKGDCETKGQVKAVFSVFNTLDSDGDVVLPDAVRSGFKSGDVPMVWSHKWDMPIGKGKINKDKDKATFEGNIFMDTESGKEAYNLVKSMGDLQQWSFGFKVNDSEYGKYKKDGSDDETDVRYLKDLSVYEVSPVLVGANQDTFTMAIKSDKETEAKIVQSIEFDQEQKEALAKDIANLRLGLGVETSRLATEISVNTTRANQPSGASEIATAGFLQAAGTVAGGYADYSLTKSGRTNNTNTNTTSNFGGYGTQRNSNRQLGVK